MADDGKWQTAIKSFNYSTEQSLIYIMPATYDVIYTHEEAKAAKRKRNYLKAARLYRMCHNHYNYGELGDIFYSNVLRYGLSAYDSYLYCKSKLTNEAQMMLEKEENEMGDWREFIGFDSDRIEMEKDSPYPNKPSFWKKWMKYLGKLFSSS